MSVPKFVCMMMLTWAGIWARVWQNAPANVQAEDVQTTIVGVWRGHSVCTDKNSACHDETNVYHFAAISGRPNWFTVTASKVVGGKEIVMGSGEWKFDEKKKVLESEKPPIRMTIDGKKMEGALSLADGTVYRRIYLEKEN
jgi:hypothetical protein